jgi:L-seryl-tRNA(Ser) seleniumtransferase
MVENMMIEKQKILASIPSVDELLRGKQGLTWLDNYPRVTVIRAIRESLLSMRKAILKGKDTELDKNKLFNDIETLLSELNSYKLRAVINATGIVIHTNLGRSLLSQESIDNLIAIGGSYSNLEFELAQGIRGKRYSHIVDILKELTGAQDAMVVNNNAAAVFLCLSTVAKNREVIVSRGELIEIGGSFRIPDVMEASGAILKEVGTTNKTHLYDYEQAINEGTELLLKVHRSNYRIIGFTSEVTPEELVRLGNIHGILTMCDLGSGCLIDLEKYGIRGEPTVKHIVNKGVELVTFSGDKLLGGPQGGVIVGKKELIQKIQKNPLTRAVRIDKLTLAGFESTLRAYRDEEKACHEIPTLRMLTEPLERIEKRAQKLTDVIQRSLHDTDASVRSMKDQSQAGGGSLPETELPTYVAALKTEQISADKIARMLRFSLPPVIVRIKDERILFDARTIREDEIDIIALALKKILSHSE